MAAITAITGFQDFPNLEDIRLDGSVNGTETVDVSGLVNLTNIRVRDMIIPGSEGEPSLKYFNVSGCSSLETIYMDDSNFSEGFPSLDGLNSLVYFDADQCGITGSLDLSNLPNLRGFDLYGNTSLSEVIISTSQPIGEDYSLSFGGCGLTEESVNQILITLYDKETSNGNLSLDGGTNAVPTGAGATALYEMVDTRGWSISYNTNSTTVPLGSGSSGEVCNIESGYYTTYYMITGTTGLAGHSLYTDDLLITPAPAGWYSDGSVRVQVTGATGLMGTPVSCV